MGSSWMGWDSGMDGSSWMGWSNYPSYSYGSYYPSYGSYYPSYSASQYMNWGNQNCYVDPSMTMYLSDGERAGFMLLCTVVKAVDEEADDDFKGKMLRAINDNTSAQD